MVEQIRVLHIVGAMYPGGMENFIMNLYENIDRRRIQFDFAVHMIKENDYTEKIKEMGGIVYELPRLTQAPLKNIRSLYRIIKEKDYKIVIRHTANALVVPQLWAAKKAGAVVICHSHTETDSKLLLHKLGRLFINRCVDERFACSDNAGKWMFKNGSYRIIHNAVNIEKFAYNALTCERMRREFDMYGKNIYCHIGNFFAMKNHKFLLKIYAEIAKLDSNAAFFCVGEGDLRPEIERQTAELGIQDKVILTGARKDVNDLMSLFDVLIFPSIYEGLPLTLIEAQAAALPCIISDNITDDVIVTKGLVEKESIEIPPAVWAKKAVEMVKNHDRVCQYENIAKKGYDIRSLSKWYENFFEQAVERR